MMYLSLSLTSCFHLQLSCLLKHKFYWWKLDSSVKNENKKYSLPSKENKNCKSGFIPAVSNSIA